MPRGVYAPPTKPDVPDQKSQRLRALNLEPSDQIPPMYHQNVRGPDSLASP